ncbi:MAG: amylo-alpha-1,6-glucosidase, partial [Acetatifactor sp.]|nr:amylo-alpha-1,6-glucosidase [Acetatifactor sp.]
EHERQECGWKCQTSFVYEDYPRWSYVVEGVEICKTMALMPGENTVGISYEIRNRSGKRAVLKVLPHLQFVPKGASPGEGQVFEISLTEGVIRSNGRSLYFSADGTLEEFPVQYQEGLYYRYDVNNGRPEPGRTAVNHSVSFEAEPGQMVRGELVYGTEPVKITAGRIHEMLTKHRTQLREQSGLKDETARELAAAAGQFVSYRASTEEQTILAGFPFFEDWGRDTMIALTGCCLSTRQYHTAESILRTFMRYCRKGLMPNLFPEGEQEPRYNTVDAALLFILAVYEYYQRTGNLAFVREAYPVMEEIVDWYEKGTDFNIAMEEDGLIRAGAGFDQVTWMDVRVGDILPTPRHGKPVEINAYWYNVLCIMSCFEKLLRDGGEETAGENCVREMCRDALSIGEEMRKAVREAASEEDGLKDACGEYKQIGQKYASLAARVKESFRKQFWNEEAHCLKDVISGTRADGQIRCNQIWAVSLPFPLLDKEQEKQVVDTVFRRLYTSLGLRTLDPEDPEFKPVYTGELLQRDLAYHQGTVWVFPLGGFYLAYLKVHGYSEEARDYVRRQLLGTRAALREGCIGQLPEIYDGQFPVFSKGCFAQAWSVGELLRVY